jgi:hypothetical protein
MAKMCLAALSVHRHEESMKLKVNMIPGMIHLYFQQGPPLLLLSHTLKPLNA